MHAQPLAPADFEALEDTLLRYGDDHSVLNVAELDGYFTALVSGPAPVAIDEWFPAIWGGQNPKWKAPTKRSSFWTCACATSTPWRPNWPATPGALRRASTKPSIGPRR